MMSTLKGIVRTLQKERQVLQQRIEQINAGLNALQGLNGRNGRSLGGRTHTRRKMSLGARRRIARAQKLRWARYHAKTA
jgi:hypothetical protein